MDNTEQDLGEITHHELVTGLTKPNAALSLSMVVLYSENSNKNEPVVICDPLYFERVSETRYEIHIKGHQTTENEKTFVLDIDGYYDMKICQQQVIVTDTSTHKYIAKFCRLTAYFQKD